MNGEGAVGSDEMPKDGGRANKTVVASTRNIRLASCRRYERPVGLTAIARARAARVPAAAPASRLRLPVAVRVFIEREKVDGAVNNRL